MRTRPPPRCCLPREGDVIFQSVAHISLLHNHEKWDCDWGGEHESEEAHQRPDAALPIIHHSETLIIPF